MGKNRPFFLYLKKIAGETEQTQKSLKTLPCDIIAAERLQEQQEGEEHQQEGDIIEEEEEEDEQPQEKWGKRVAFNDKFLPGKLDEIRDMRFNATEELLNLSLGVFIREESISTLSIISLKGISKRNSKGGSGSGLVRCPNSILGDISRLEVLVGGKRAGNNSPEIINEAADICRRLFNGGFMDIGVYREFIDELTDGYHSD